SKPIRSIHKGVRGLLGFSEVSSGYKRPFKPQLSHTADGNELFARRIHDPRHKTICNANV
ncbi:UNVERIFIED_CONTAM: hypothetical protein NY603_41035, partial [Bacteroidetes bacterium 56_B9]